MVPVPAPTQGVKSRREKTKLMEKQRESSICVKLLKKVEKSVIEQVLTNVHTGIDKICFPRQKVPRFVFVRCSSTEIKPEVWKAIKKLKNEKLGPLLPKVVRPPKPKPKKVETESKRTIDPLTLVLEMIPKELSTEKLKNEFKDCKKASRFNARRCYLYFKSIESAFEAYEKLTSEEVLGHKLKVRYRKVMKTTKKGKKIETTATAAEDDEESNSDIDSAEADSESGEELQSESNEDSVEIAESGSEDEEISADESEEDE